MLIVQLNQTVSDPNRCSISPVITLHILYEIRVSEFQGDIEFSANFLHNRNENIFNIVLNIFDLPSPYRHSTSVSTIVTPDLR